MKKKTRLPKYAIGTSITNYIEDPAEALAENAINIAKAKYEAATDPLVVGLKTAGSLAMQAGQSMGGFGAIKGKSKSPAVVPDTTPKNDLTAMPEVQFGKGGKVKSELTQSLDFDEDMIPLMAMGMSLSQGKKIKFNSPEDAKAFIQQYQKVIPQKQATNPGNSVPVEVEGKEVGETPDGKLLDFKGPSHENGGIPVSLPEGTEIYSDRILIGGKTMAERKKSRENAVARYSKKIEGGDNIARNTLNRLKVSHSLEEQMDNAIQDILHRSTPSQEVMATGGNITFGDAINMGGNLFTGLAPLFTTMKSRATDTPNKNYFKGYGEEGLNKMAQSETFLQQQMDLGMKGLREDTGNQIAANRESARGVNTKRALDLASYSGQRKAEENLYSNYANSMMGLMEKEAQLENMQDQVVMGGEQARDLADRANKDAYYSALNKDLQGVGQAVANAGKQANEIYGRGKTGDIMNQMYSNFGFDFGTGQVIGKAAETLGVDNGNILTKSAVQSAWDSGKRTNPFTGQNFASLEEMLTFFGLQ